MQVLGLKNGDIVTAINGMTISSPESALEVYSSLRGAKKVVLSLVRRGQPLTPTYIIR